MGAQDQIPRLEVPDLTEDEVHVWHLDLSKPADSDGALLRVLSSDEHHRVAQFRFQPDRRRFSVARAHLRLLLAGYLQSDPAHFQFRNAEKGKPFLDSPHLDSRLTFNISHSGDAILLAFTRGREIGVDIEQIRHDADLDAIARRFFSSAEQQRLQELHSEERPDAFFRCWTRKEAYIKARGEGLSLPLAQFDVSIREDDDNALLATRPDADEAKRWTLRDIAAPAGYAAAVAASGQGWRVIRRDL